MIRRGDIYLADLPIGGRHPVVIVTRDVAIPLLTSLVAVVVSSTVRGHVAEVELDVENGLEHQSAANCDDLVTVDIKRLIRYMGHLRTEKLEELNSALSISLGLDR